MNRNAACQSILRGHSILRGGTLALVGLLVATSVNAQQIDPTARLAGRLPTEAETPVLERIASAGALGLPSESLVDLALEGVAKGRSPDQVVAALDRHLGALTVARAALGGSDTGVPGLEVEAAGLALRMGADADAISRLARSRPDGRSLEVPLLVLGGLSQRGLPSDQALERVLEGLAARMDDRGFLAGLRAEGAQGGPRLDPPAGPFAPGAGRGGPPSGLPQPVGPAGGSRPERPGRGGPPEGVPGNPSTPSPAG